MRYVLVVIFALGTWSELAQAQYQCPAGSVNVGNGYQIMCQCPDGSFAGINGCRSQYTAPARPQGVPCGNGYCPYGTTCSRNGNFCLSQGQVDCGTYTCGSGNKCASRNRCFPINSNECGNGYCGAGLMCSSNKQCIDPEKTASGPGGAIGTLSAIYGIYAKLTGLQQLLPSTSLSQSVKSQPTVNGVSWSAIQATVGTPGGAGLAPASSPQAAASFNPFTNTYSIPASVTGSSAAPSFAQPPVQPGLQAVVQATKPPNDNLSNVGTMQMQPQPPQENNGGTVLQNSNPYDTHCTGAFKC